MDQIKIGKFITSMRKEQNLTQKQLAELLNISDKTISKWECGNGMPEVSIMLPLCEQLKINVNELLSGEKITSTNYNQRAEENMIKFLKEKEDIKEIKENRRKMAIAISLLFFSVTIAVLSGIIIEITNMLLAERILMILFSIICIAIASFLSISVEKEIGCFECSKCNAQFSLNFKEHILGSNFITRKKIKCPECEETGFCKRKITN